jgi:pimeloyl-ACP methyl ester carboxylesterase
MKPTLALFLATWFGCVATFAIAAEPTVENSAQLGDLSIHYRIYGDGEPLLLLHGFGSSGIETWGPFLDELLRDFRLIVPDLRGHGRSTNPDETFTHRQSAKDMYALLDHLKIARVSAMGVSTGGMTLLHMATTQRDRIHAMVLIGATHYFPKVARDQMRQVNGQEYFETNPYWGHDRMRRIHKLGDEQINKLRRIFFNFQYSYDDMNFTPPFLSTIQARTFIVHGDRDEFFPIHIPVKMYNSIPGSSLWIVSDMGHVPMFKPNALFIVDDSLPYIPKMVEFLKFKD